MHRKFRCTLPILIRMGETEIYLRTATFEAALP
nr:MAG TPA: hypothetical protein [Caudoviricetes sp.]